MAQVFISFVHEEENFAKAVQQFLKDKLDNQSVFMSADKWQVIAGEIWLDRIQQELDSAKVVILMLSQKSVGRPWVNFEAGAAWLTGKVIIPACFCELTKGNLPKPYSNIQALDLPNDIYYLVRSVAHYLGFPIAPPPIVLGSPELKQLEDAIAHVNA